MLHTYPISDKWLRLIGISLISLLVLLSSSLLDRPLTAITLGLILTVPVSITLYWLLNRTIIVYFRYRTSLSVKLGRRLALTLLACMLATSVLAWFVNGFKYLLTYQTLVGYTNKPGGLKVYIDRYELTATPFGLDLFNSFLMAVFFLIVYELLFYSQDSSRYKNQLAQSERERERLELANLRSQLDVLKQQVNPHFLFNALNALSALIAEDPHQAEVFVDKLSGVYRYVLRANRSDEDGTDPEAFLTPLSAELDFIENYYHLLQTRYGNGLSLTINVPDTLRSGQLPPLTLQLLVENAVKHNVVSPKRPLRITIKTNGMGALVVQNNRQPKATRALSNGVGLSNIQAKYQMLNLPPPSVEESAEYFTVRLALLS